EDQAGLKPLRYLDSAETVYPDANWRVALEPSTEVDWVTFPDAAPFESGMLFDMPDSRLGVAGFLVTRDASAASAVEAAAKVEVSLRGASGIGAVQARASGAPITSLDGHEAVVGTILEVT